MCDNNNTQSVGSVFIQEDLTMVRRDLQLPIDFSSTYVQCLPRRNDDNITIHKSLVLGTDEREAVEELQQRLGSAHTSLMSSLDKLKQALDVANEHRERVVVFGTEAERRREYGDSVDADFHEWVVKNSIPVTNKGKQVLMLGGATGCKNDDIQHLSDRIRALGGTAVTVAIHRETSTWDYRISAPDKKTAYRIFQHGLHKPIPWNESPEGTTHFDGSVSSVNKKWFKYVGAGGWYYWTGKHWNRLNLQESILVTLIPKPTLRQMKDDS